MLKTKQKMNKLEEAGKAKKPLFLDNFRLKIRTFLENINKSFNPGIMSRQRSEILTLVCLISLTSYVLLFKQNYSKIFISQKTPSVRQKSSEEIEKEKFKKDIEIMVAGHPIEAMIPYIIKKDRKTAAYLIGIAKKESNWGKRRPVLAGQDCFNYWGFRAERERMGSGGHTCFIGPREAVDIVSRRIAEIIERNNAESAKDMLVWKCGSSCAATGGQAAANKWARDVDLYAKKVLN